MVKPDANLSFGSVCSGIEAASCAWLPLGFSALWFSEIEDFPSAVLRHHHPNIPNLGDMTLIANRVLGGDIAAPDILVGGTPCQAFSIAGLREGLNDERGQLSLKYIELANAIDKIRHQEGKDPAVIVWENVPGVLSSKDNAFGCFLAGLAGAYEPAEPGNRPESGKNNPFWRWDAKTRCHIPKWPHAGCVNGTLRQVAWRVLDAQYFGVAQRRKRVFVVASAGADFDPRKVLFESEGVRRDTAPIREKGSDVAVNAGDRIKVGSRFYKDLNQSRAAVGIVGAYRMTAFGEYADDETASTFKARDYKDASDLAVMRGVINSETYAIHGTQDPGTNINLGHTLGRNNGQENAVVYGIPGNWIGRAPENGGNATEPMNNVAPCLTVADRHGVAFSSDKCLTPWAPQQKRIYDSNAECSPTLCGSYGGGGQYPPAYFHHMQVRRLTPIECERLQGFPDNWTLIPTEKKKKITRDEYSYLRHHNPELTEEQAYKLAADGPRYKAIGNSMAVPVMQWIGQRIASLKTTHKPRREVLTPDTYTRSVFKWPGGKFLSLAALFEHFPDGSRLIEPFVGGGSVFLNAGFCQNLLADANSDLIGFYKVLQREGHTLIALAWELFEKHNSPEGFSSVRDGFNNRLFDEIHHAAAFLFLNRHCFNGLTRYNLKGHFNVGYGKYKKPHFPLEEMEELMGLSPCCEFVCGDFSQTISQAGAGDVVYCDPPYLPMPDKNGFTAYTGTSFGIDEHAMLVASCVAAHQRGATIIITNSGAPDGLTLYRDNGFTLHPLHARRTISCSGETRHVAHDVIAVLAG